MILGLALLPAFAPAAELSTAQRLDLLERRVNRVTDLTLAVDELREENRRLRGQIEDLNHQIEQLSRKQRDIYLDLDQRLSGGAAAQAPATQGPAASGTTPGAMDAPPTATAIQPAAATDRRQVEAEYQAAYELLGPQQKRYEEAAKAFTVFLQKYPNDELTPNAQYWLGEAYYVSQHNAEAQQAFEAVVAQYPESTKAAGALFKIGRLQQAAGKNDAARSSYQKVVDDYPDSPAAGLARQRLGQVGG